MAESYILILGNIFVLYCTIEHWRHIATLFSERYTAQIVQVHTVTILVSKASEILRETVASGQKKVLWHR